MLKTCLICVRSQCSSNHNYMRFNKSSNNRSRRATSSSLGTTNNISSSSNSNTRPGDRARPRHSKSSCHPCCCSVLRRPTPPPSRLPLCSVRLPCPRCPPLPRLLARHCRRHESRLDVFAFLSEYHPRRLPSIANDIVFAFFNLAAWRHKLGNTRSMSL